MEINGKVLEVLEKQTGKSAKGQWSKQFFIIETQEDYPKKICIASWNDKIDLTNIKTGDEVKVFINIESREYNGKWYTDVKGWKLELLDSGSSGEESSGSINSIGLDDIPPEEDTDDLPF